MAPGLGFVMSTAVEAPPATTIARADLAAALRLASSIKAACVHIDLSDGGLAAHAHDVAVQVALDAEGGHGAIVVDRVRLARLLAGCGPRMDLAVDDDKLRITSGPATYSLPSVVDERAPHDTSGDPVDPITIDAPVLVEALRRALPSASKDETRPLLCCVALFPARHTMVSTDSYRLAAVRYGDDCDDETPPWLLLREGMASIKSALAKKLGAVTLWQTSSHVHAQFEGVRWAMRRIAGAYPDYRKLLPETPGETTLKVDRDDLLAAGRAALLVVAGNTPLRLTIGSVCTAHVPARAEGGMSWRLDSASVEGPALEIGINPRFVAEACATAPVERLTVRFIAPQRPLLIEAARDTYLLMPFRLTA